MLKKINIIPRWIIFLLDIGVTGFSFLLAFVIKQNLELKGLQWNSIFNTFFLLLITNALVFASVKTYSGIVRYTGLQDAVRITKSIAMSAALLFLFSKVSSKYITVFVLDNVVIVLYASFSFLSLISYRIVVKFFFLMLRTIR
jgi:FlaA1/EpsC-like NDP-sugar epimerase